jgi:hypothetical protein
VPGDRSPKPKRDLPQPADARHRAPAPRGVARCSAKDPLNSAFSSRGAVLHSSYALCRPAHLTAASGHPRRCCSKRLSALCSHPAWAAGAETAAGSTSTGAHATHVYPPPLPPLSSSTRGNSTADGSGHWPPHLPAHTPAAASASAVSWRPLGTDDTSSVRSSPPLRLPVPPSGRSTVQSSAKVPL